MARFPCSGTLGRSRLEMTIIDSGIASPTRANAPTAIHGSLMRSVSLCGLEDSVLRVVESGGGIRCAACFIASNRA